MSFGKTLRVRHLVRATLFCVAIAAVLRGSLSAQSGGQSAGNGTFSASTDPRADSGEWSLGFESFLGHSGKVRFLVSNSTPASEIPRLEALFGPRAVRTPGVYTAHPDSGALSMSLFTLLPFDAKAGGRVGDYRVGFWPAERRQPRTPAYENPDGFIVVTEDNQDTHVSEHFRLRDFLTHDQQDVWPKYLVLREELIDKLELVIRDLQDHGIPVSHMSVLSGFRTPQYNVRGVGRGGRALDSRHQFGDAADVFIDNNGDGRMDDLNHDRRVNAKDVRVIVDAVERVESAFLDLIGGMGLYRATTAHGPFVHIDVRGRKARWGQA